MAVARPYRRTRRARERSDREAGIRPGCTLPHRNCNLRGRKSVHGIDRCDLKGSAVKIILAGVLLFLLSIVAYSRISAGPGGAGEPLSETRAAPPIAASNHNHQAANLSTYVFLHRTWNEDVSAPTTRSFGVCSE